MKYETNLSATISVFHPSATSEAVETAMGLDAVRSISKGEYFNGKSGRRADRTVAHFTVHEECISDPEKSVDKCIELIRECDDVEVLRAAEVWVVIGLYSRDFVQLNLPAELIAALEESGVGIAFENRA